MTNDDSTTPDDNAPEKASTERKDVEPTTSDKPGLSTADSAPDQRQPAPREPADSIRTELDDLRDQASRRARRSQRASRFWATTHMLLGIVAAALALVAAAVVVSDTIDDGYALAATLIAVALVLLTTFVHPDTRGANARMTARGWNALEVDLHVFLVADYDETGVEARKDVLRSAMARTLDLMAGRYEGAEPRRG